MNSRESNIKYRAKLKSKLGERLYSARLAEQKRNYRLRKKVKEEQRQLSHRQPTPTNTQQETPTNTQQEEKDFRATAEEDLGNECVDSTPFTSTHS